MTYRVTDRVVSFSAVSLIVVSLTLALTTRRQLRFVFAFWAKMP